MNKYLMIEVNDGEVDVLRSFMIMNKEQFEEVECTPYMLEILVVINKVIKECDEILGEVQ